MQLFVAEWCVRARADSAHGHQVVPCCPAPSLTLTIYCESQGRQVIRIEFDKEEMIRKREGCSREAASEE